MKKIIVLALIMFLAGSYAFAQGNVAMDKTQRLFSKDTPLKIVSNEQIDSNNVKLIATMKHKRGPFTGTKDYNESISLPEELSANGYKLYKREIVSFKGKGWMLNEDMEALGYSCKVHISKNWVESETINVTIALYARNDGEMPATLDSPSIDSPSDNATLKFDNPVSKNHISWSGNGNLFRVRLADKNSGKKIINRTYTKNTLDLNSDELKDGGIYILSIEQTDDSLRWSVPTIISFRVYFNFEVCPRCFGNGDIDCTFCHGSGNIQQVNYDAEGHPHYISIPCSYCNGTGHVRCPYCGGKGWVYKH